MHHIRQGRSCKACLHTHAPWCPAQTPEQAANRKWSLPSSSPPARTQRTHARNARTHACSNAIKHLRWTTTAAQPHVAPSAACTRWSGTHRHAPDDSVRRRRVLGTRVTCASYSVRNSMPSRRRTRGRGCCGRQGRGCVGRRGGGGAGHTDPPRAHAHAHVPLRFWQHPNVDSPSTLRDTSAPIPFPSLRATLQITTLRRSKKINFCTKLRTPVTDLSP